MAKNKVEFIIGGPCAIETKEQFWNTVKDIHKYVNIFRAGVWKARTSPSDYPGFGDRALEWIRLAQKKYNTPFAVEVGTTRHVELAIQHDIKILWIGARTTSNPFAVQELANALRGVDVEIWIKNPIFPNLKLWIGAFERFSRNKITHTKAIYRGFYAEKLKKYRNAPRWDLLREFQKSCPNTAVIFDPSHIAGQANLIRPLCAKARKENIHGLMIEVHSNPDKALSDSNQQLNPRGFIKLLRDLDLTQSA
mgnify:CR=1 FL=1